MKTPLRKTWKKAKPCPNTYHRFTIPETLRTGLIEVRSDVHIRQWKREGNDIVVTFSDFPSRLIVSKYVESRSKSE